MKQNVTIPQNLNLRKRLLELMFMGAFVAVVFQNCGLSGDISSANATSGASGLSSTKPTSGVYVIGPTEVASSSCRRFSVQNFDANSNPLNVSQATQVTLSGFGAGSVYSDVGCTTSLPGVNQVYNTTIPLGLSFAYFYFKDAANENLNFQANVLSTTSGLSVGVMSGTSTWFNTLAQGAAGPPKLIEPKMVFHTARGSVIMYRGTTASTSSALLATATMSASMWEYKNGSWTQLCAACAPGPRMGHGLVYDSFRNRIVLFGGASSPTSYMNDVWEWDGTTWANVTTTIKGTSPAGRRAMYMTFDSHRNKSVIFAGEQSGPMMMSDVYEYDGTTWTGPFAPVGGPTAREALGSQAAFDPVQNLSYFYSSSNMAGDLWAWNGLTWTNICGGVCALGARDGAGVAFDPSRNVLVIAFGVNTTSELSDIWEMGSYSHTWSGPKYGPTALTARDGMSFVFNPSTGHSVFFGGNSCGSGCNFNDTWEYGYP